MRKVRGFTLLEIMIVMILGTGSVLWASSIREVFVRAETAKRLDRDAQLLLKSMNLFYVRNCTVIPFPTVSEARLRADNILVGGNFINPWGGGYQLSIVRLQPTNPQLRVSLVFKNTNDANYVSGFSSNAKVSGSTVTWTSYSTLNRISAGITRQLERQAFGIPMC